jgi:hypothetical protein
MAASRHAYIRGCALFEFVYVLFLSTACAAIVQAVQLDVLCAVFHARDPYCVKFVCAYRLLLRSGLDCTILALRYALCTFLIRLYGLRRECICGPHYIIWMDVHPLIRDCAHSDHCVCRVNTSYTAWCAMRGF